MGTSSHGCLSGGECPRRTRKEEGAYPSGRSNVGVPSCVSWTPPFNSPQADGMTKSSHRFLQALAGLSLLLVQLASVFAQGPAGTPAVVARVVELRGEGVEGSRQPGVWDPAHT